MSGVKVGLKFLTWRLRDLFINSIEPGVLKPKNNGCSPAADFPTPKEPEEKLGTNTGPGGEGGDREELNLNNYCVPLS